MSRWEGVLSCRAVLPILATTLVAVVSAGAFGQALNAIACLECGANFKMLKRHLNTEHGLTPTQYRARWNLNAEYPIIAADYAAKRKELAIKIGLGRKPVVVEAPKPVRNAGRPRKLPA